MNNRVHIDEGLIDVNVNLNYFNSFFRVFEFGGQNQLSF